MNSSKAKEILFEASRLRVPKFRQENEGDKLKHTTQEKVHLLECWAIDAARWRSHLEEARLWMDEASYRLGMDWKKLDGWEEFLPEGKRVKDAKRDEVLEAKRLVSPDLFDGLEKAKHLVKQLSDQIRRIEKDEDRVSRIYTFLTGA